MIVRVTEWYAARSLREQRLLAAMLVIALPLFLWLLVIVPLNRAYDSALERHLAAVDRSGRVRALAEVGNASRAGAAVPGGDITLVVAERAARAGLTLASNSAAGAGQVQISVASAKATAITGWLAGLERDGLTLDDVRIAPTGDGNVSLSARVGRGR
jgi:general secretion pathway protein M